jgi:hypothetical protein
MVLVTAQAQPPWVYEYATDVNKGSINMRFWQKRLNEWAAQGWRLAHVFEQDGNTVQVFERVKPQ